MAQGKYANLNGIRYYYEIHGSGLPLVLLHGGVVGIESFGPNLAAFAETRQVIAVDLQGHGRTADIDRPLRFETLADDIVALIRYLGFDRADVMGYSLGGGVALQMAIRHMDSIRKLVLISTPFKRQGWYPDVLEGMANMTPEAAEAMKQSPLGQLYPDVNWSVLFSKLVDLLGREYDWSEQVAAIRLPTMLVFADADAVRPAHILDFYALLGGGLRDAGLDGSYRSAARLAILPGATHYNILSTATVAALVTPFLDGVEQPASGIPS